MDSIIGCVTDLLNEKPPFENPHEVIKLIINRLKNNNLEDHKKALCDAVQLARHHPDILKPNMKIINTKVIDFLNYQRIQVVRLACQTAGELFRTMRCVDRPIFDHIVVGLMCKTADKNQQLRIDANWALDKMVISVPLLVAIKALAGCRHKNPSVKVAQLRLMHGAVVIGDPKKILISPGLKEARRLVLRNCITAIEDSNADVRFKSKKLLQLLKKTNYEVFSSALVHDVSWDELKLAEKNLNVDNLAEVLKKNGM
ncbi:uncharacterized protein LOC126898189 [Daktulosphaira vitifoliae]|uniref:uncharacterized protein LOC126898189 n=1 Tax=Daktulosphaira vitifoliae TaxID=58002 RepID=UPI0021AA0B52|nr:uncharacterized protein LOC126898189 [Daktulosphaira vitifoliae]